MKLMKQTASFLFLVSLILFLTIPFFNLINHSISIASDADRVEYDMPYPGILPDHPLYPVKILRDRILEFMTRDNIKKAQLYLLYSDKRVGMAQQLAKKGKVKQAISTFSKAEKYFLKIPDLLRASKQQGVTPPPELVRNAKLSNKKHKEILEMMLKQMPQGELDQLRQVLDLNQQIAKSLEGIQ